MISLEERYEKHKERRIRELRKRYRDNPELVRKRF